MSTAVVKAFQVSGSTVEVLAVDQSDGSDHRLQTDGTLASLKSAMQQATKKASDIKTKPEIYEGMTFDFSPVAIAVEVPTQEQTDRQAFFAADRLVTVLQEDQAKGYPIDSDALAQAQKQAASLYQRSYRETA